MFKFFRRKKKRIVALALGGGSARGLAHIGVLKVLEREGIPIDMIVGTSMGALIGAAYATGIPIKDMEAHTLGFTSKRLMDPTIPRMGMLAGEKLEMTIRDLIDGKTFKDARIPIAVVTTDIETGEEVVYQQGSMRTGKAAVGGACGLSNSMPRSFRRNRGASNASTNTRRRLAADASRTGGGLGFIWCCAYSCRCA